MPVLSYQLKEGTEDVFLFSFVYGPENCHNILEGKADKIIKIGKTDYAVVELEKPWQKFHVNKNEGAGQFFIKREARIIWLKLLRKGFKESEIDLDFQYR